MRWPKPRICRQPGELSDQHSLPQRKACLQRLEHRLQRRYACVRILQRLGWSIPPVKLLQPLQALASLVPRDPVAQDAARAVLRELNRSELNALNRTIHADKTNVGSVLPIIVGCKSRLQAARLAKNAFEESASPNLRRALIVIGNPRLPDWALRFCPQQALLEVSADDSYEGLPQKVTTALAVLALLQTPPPVLKLDDDARPGNLTNLTELAQQIDTREPEAAGFPIVTPSQMHLDRGWHMGKSKRANLQPFSSLGTRTWLSGGAGYLLNPAAVDLIGHVWMHTNGFIRSMVYEDVCVSMLLQAAEAEIHWLENPADLGLFSERQQEFQDGQWSVPPEFFQAAQ